MYNFIFLAQTYLILNFITVIFSNLFKLFKKWKLIKVLEGEASGENKIKNVKNKR